MGYIGNTPVEKASRVLTEGTLSSSTNIIPVPGGFSPNNIFVYINGSRQAQNDYDDSDGSNVDVSPSMPAGEMLPVGTEYVIEEVRTFESANHYSKPEVNAYLANKLDANNALGGAAQSWQDVTASRDRDVIYTNSTGTPILLSITGGTLSGATVSISLDGVVLTVFENNGGALHNTAQLSAVVPAGSTYLVSRTGDSFIDAWWELR